MVGVQWAVLAHQGGWDEMALVAVPIALFVVLLRIANARATSAEAPDPEQGATAPDQSAEPDR